VIAVALAVVLAGGGAAAAWFFHKPSKPPGYVSVQPSALSFPAVPVNTSASRSLSVVNNRKSLVTVTKILITGPAIDDFSLSRQGSASSSYGAAPSSVQLATSRQPPCVGTLQANRTCNLSVVFTPSAAGTRSADLEIYFASRSQPQKVVLTGIGMANGSSSTSSSPRTSPPDTPPALTLQSDQIIEATGPDGAVDSYTASASDAEDGSLVPTCSPASDTVFPLGTTTVSCSVTDSGGKTTTGSFTVTVQDTTPPSLSLPADITVPSFKPTVVTYPASATDLVDASVAVICTPESGSTFPLGMTTVDCSATDVHGNAATGSFTVTVTPPPPPA
jgi:hypothetical protein